MRAVICFHGLLSTKADFTYLFPMLNQMYDKIACYDLPGHGYNTQKFNTENVKRFVIEIYDSLAITYEQIDIIGYSMGGIIAAFIQSIRPVHRLVLLAPSYRYLNLKNYHLHPKAKSNTSIAKAFPKKNYFHIFRFAKIISDLSDEFHIIYPDTLILWGTDDYLVKEESGILLYQMIRSHNRQFIKLRDHNHFNILRSPTVAQYIFSFLMV